MKKKYIKRPPRVFKNDKGKFIIRRGRKVYINSPTQSNKQIVNIVLNNVRNKRRVKRRPKKDIIRNKINEYKHIVVDVLKDNKISDEEKASILKYQIEASKLRRMIDMKKEENEAQLKMLMKSKLKNEGLSEREKKIIQQLRDERGKSVALEEDLKLLQQAMKKAGSNKYDGKEINAILDKLEENANLTKDYINNSKIIDDYKKMDPDELYKEIDKLINKGDDDDFLRGIDLLLQTKPVEEQTYSGVKRDRDKLNIARKDVKNQEEYFRLKTQIENLEERIKKKEAKLKEKEGNPRVQDKTKEELKKKIFDMNATLRAKSMEFANKYGKTEEPNIMDDIDEPDETPYSTPKKNNNEAERRMEDDDDEEPLTQPKKNNNVAIHRENVQPNNKPPPIPDDAVDDDINNPFPDDLIPYPKKKGTGPPDNSLYDSEINKIMDFFDAKDYGFKGVYSSDELNEIKISPSEKRISFIMNTSPKSISTGHWVGIYIDKEEGTLEYMDSLAQPPSDDFKMRIKKLIDKMNPTEYFVFKINKIKHQAQSSSCGFHSILFLLGRYEGRSFKDVSGYSIVREAEKNVQQFKEKLKQKFGYI